MKVREADVPVVDDQDCTVKINAVTEKLFILPSSSFCAGGEEGNDACQVTGFMTKCISLYQLFFLHRAMGVDLWSAKSTAFTS